MVKVFIDGLSGTTGLKIEERISGRGDIEVVRLSEKERKDVEAKARVMGEVDYAILCLPDEASRQVVKMVEERGIGRLRILDSSSAHRTSKEFVYGFPELGEGFRSRIKTSRFVAVPGCYASGFIAIVYPLVKGGILPPDYPLVCHAVSGYSGAGKKGIAQYEAGGDRGLLTPRLYALTQNHKHLKEMTAIPSLLYPPLFSPYVCNYYSGMTVTVPLHARLLHGATLKTIHDALSRHYENEHFVKVLPLMKEDLMSATFLSANTLVGTNFMELIVYGNDERIAISARFDNLGKGASSAALQCLNIMMGIDERTGLE